jgi:hypothetical protein
LIVGHVIRRKVSTDILVSICYILEYLLPVGYRANSMGVDASSEGIDAGPLDLDHLGELRFRERRDDP